MLIKEVKRLLAFSSTFLSGIIRITSFPNENQNFTTFLHGYSVNGSFSKMAAENSNKLKLKTNTSSRKNPSILETPQSFSVLDVISAEKI